LLFAIIRRVQYGQWWGSRAWGGKSPRTALSREKKKLEMREGTTWFELDFCSMERVSSTFVPMERLVFTSCPVVARSFLCSRGRDFPKFRSPYVCIMKKFDTSGKLPCRRKYPEERRRKGFYGHHAARKKVLQKKINVRSTKGLIEPTHSKPFVKVRAVWVYRFSPTRQRTTEKRVNREREREREI